MSPNYNEKNVERQTGRDPNPLPLLGSTALSSITSDYRSGCAHSNPSMTWWIPLLTTLRSSAGAGQGPGFSIPPTTASTWERTGVRSGKNLPYEEDLRVPFVVRGPGVTRGKVVPEIGLNIDLAPTFAEIAGAAPTVPQDGRSLLPLLTSAAPAGWRLSFQIRAGCPGPGLDFLEAGRVASSTRSRRCRGGRVPRVWGGMPIRTSRWKYVEWANGDRELYDLMVDPYELTNRFYIEIHSTRLCSRPGFMS
jgi:hypothetical protein